MDVFVVGTAHESTVEDVLLLLQLFFIENVGILLHGTNPGTVVLILALRTIALPIAHSAFCNAEFAVAIAECRILAGTGSTIAILKIEKCKFQSRKKETFSSLAS